MNAKFKLSKNTIEENGSTSEVWSLYLNGEIIYNHFQISELRRFLEISRDIIKDKVGCIITIEHNIGSENYDLTSNIFGCMSLFLFLPKQPEVSEVVENKNTDYLQDFIEFCLKVKVSGYYFYSEKGEDSCVFTVGADSFDTYLSLPNFKAGELSLEIPDIYL